MKNLTSQRIKVTSVAALLLIQGLSQTAWAHARWIVPSHTSLTGEKSHTVTVDMSISNDLFSPTHGFMMRSNKDSKVRATPAELVMLTPDNKATKDIPFTNFDIKSVGKIKLTQSGTHHIRLQQSAVYYTTYTKPDGSKGRAFGKSYFVPNEAVELPKDVTQIKHVKYMPTLDTYVSRNGMTTTAYFNQGLEIKTASHPNDLFEGETTKFQLYVNGEAITSSTSIDVVRGGTRERNDRNIKSFTSDDSGWFEVTWKHPGMYLIETEYSEQSTQKGIDLNTYSMFSTFEVNPA